MKGAISKYFSDKGFGFIRDEYNQERFFHFNMAQNPQELLENISQYIDSIYHDQCFILEFTPDSSDKGPIATNIVLTDQVLNDLNDTNTIFQAELTGLNYETNSISYLQSGIKKGHAKPFGATAGGNGTYRIGYPEIDRSLSLSFVRKDEIGWGELDILNIALMQNKRKRVSTKLINKLEKKLLGKTVKLTLDGRKWVMVDPEVLSL